MIVEIYRLASDANGDPLDEKVGELRLVDGAIEFDVPEGEAEFLHKFQCFGVDGPLSFEDGEPWLAALPANLRGTYFWAQEAKD